MRDEDEERWCKDYGDRPGCLGAADERYTMRFDDLGEPPILWCARCGPEAHRVNDALQEAFGRPDFTEALEAAVTQAEDRRRREAH